MRDIEPFYTLDGSVGLYSYIDNDVFHSKFGALSEAWEKFILPADIKYSDLKNLKVLDICYGIGYNTKSLMSQCINLINEKKIILKKRKINFLKKQILKFLFYIVTLDVNKINRLAIILLTYNDLIYSNNNIEVDCLDINDYLVKLSPFFKNKQIFEIQNRNNNYFVSKFVNLLVNRVNEYIFTKEQNPNLLKSLNIDFNKNINSTKYKLNKQVNYILINKLVNQLDNNNFNKKVILKSIDYIYEPYLDKNMLNYIDYFHFNRLNTSSRGFLLAFLHNIYYRYLSLRYNKALNNPLNRIFNIKFHIKDARKVINSINNKYDLIFLDAFTYSKAPQLWSYEFIKKLHDNLSDNGVIITYSNSALVRNTFLENNFYVGKIYNFNSKKFIGTIASKNKNKIKYPLTEFEFGLCKTKAGIVYHDLDLNSSTEFILKNREIDLKNSSLMSSSQYMKLKGKKGGGKE